ncbi:MAG: 16S rRNA (cytosine(967)-C(5))-methyltransferase RsmB [Lachnospiraceae bacterium]|nr:16S rRNA (cytosine(967)-C(5))-methyltransferase RsmB [Lachnospiraceae bacterium]
MDNDKNLRVIVFDSLMECLKNGRKSHILIKDVLDKYDYLDNTDKNFIKKLFEGTIEKMITLDHVLDECSSKPMSKCKFEIKLILEMAAYQILFMDRVPDSAACDEAVKLCKKKSREELSGFVNGVLRALVRRKDELLKFDSIEPLSTRMSVKYSVPEWIVSMMIKEIVGKDPVKADKFFKALTDKRPTVVRITDKDKESDILSKWDEKKINYVKSEKSERVYRLCDHGSVSEIPGFGEGLLYIQDESSMMAVKEAVSFCPNAKTMLDLCSAPGGKGIYALELLGRDAEGIRADVSEEKVALINDNLQRLNIKNATSVINDATILKEEFIDRFDMVIADVPCSGLGVISRKSDLKYNISNEGMAEICKLQKEIIDKAMGYVKKEGILLYSTCTLHKAENEKMRAYILDKGEFELLSEKRLCPDSDDTDGFFFAVFKKQ